MISIAAFLKGIGRIKQAIGLWSFLYLTLLLFALLFALPINSLLESQYGQTLELGGKPGSFDYTLIADLFNNQGTALSLIIAQGKWIILLFLLLSIFLKAGILKHFFQQNKSFSFSQFIANCIQYFFRFFRASIYFLIFHAILFGLAFLLFKSISGGFSPFEIENDADLVNAYYVTVPIYIGVAIFLIMAADLTRFEILHQDKPIITNAVLTSFQQLFQRFFSLLVFYLLLLLLFYGSYKLFQFVKELISPESGIGVWLILILGQLFVFLRIGIGLLRYAGLAELRKNWSFGASKIQRDEGV